MTVMKRISRATDKYVYMLGKFWICFTDHNEHIDAKANAADIGFKFRMRELSQGDCAEK